MVAHQRDLGPRDQGRQPGHELHGRHDPMGAPLARHLEQVRDPPVAQHLDPIEREGRPRAVADEALAPEIVVGREAHGAMDVEPVTRRREATLAALEVCVRLILQ